VFVICPCLQLELACLGLEGGYLSVISYCYKEIRNNEAKNQQNY
jgi:hypothetical protein